MKIHATFPLFDSSMDFLRGAGAEVDVYRDALPEPPEALRRALEGREGIICSLFDPLDAAFFAAASATLRAVAQFGVGYNNIDVEAAAARGILVTNTPGVLTDATAEMAVALMLAAARRLGEGERLARSGRWTGWEPGQMLGHGVTGKTLGIVGAGRIGAATALKTRGFEMPIVYASRRRNAELEAKMGARRMELGELLERADFVSLHVPLTPQTRHLIGEAELARMKPTAILVNTARGAVVDEAALVRALQMGRIAAAGLDVYENEPALWPGLAELPNVVLAPHLGSATLQTREDMALLASRNLVAALRGQPPMNPVNQPRRA